MTYEEAEKELEKITLKLEDGTLGLSEATKLYERGVELIEFCSKELENTKGKISVIRKKMDTFFEENIDE